MSVTFLYLPKTSVSFTAIKTVVADTDYATTLTSEEKEIIERDWQKVIEKSSKAFSKPEGLATLTSHTETTFTFRPTDYKTYASMPKLSAKAKEGMRVAAIGGVIMLRDNLFIVKKRPMTAAHAGKFDASFAGFVPNETGMLLVEKTIQDKLVKDFSITQKNIVSVRLTGVHVETSHDLSCLFDILVHVGLSQKEVEQRLTTEQQKMYSYFTQEQLIAFIEQHKQEFLPDGIAAFHASLPEEARAKITFS